MKKGLVILCVASVIVLATTITLMFTVYEGLSGSEGRLRVFLKDEVTAEQAAALEKEINRMAGVADTEYVSKERALERFKEMYSDDAEMLSQIEGNPFPAEITIAVNHSDLDSFLEVIAKKPEVSVDEWGSADISRLAPLDESQALKTTLTRLAVISSCLLVVGLAVAIYLIVYFARLSRPRPEAGQG